jgi:DNA-binding Lrp family transcriptional regulator
MTLEELCKELNVSETTVKTNFARMQKTFQKKNILVTKNGRGSNATYDIEYLNDNRAMTMFEEDKQEIILSNVSLQFINWEFTVFLAIVVTPMLVFRGSYKDFLDYAVINNTPTNIELLKKALETLAERDIIIYKVDKTNNDYFVAALYRKVEEDCKIGIEMVKECKQLQEKYNKQSFVPLLKVWLAVQIASENQPYTVAELCAMTGLSQYTVRESNKILEESQVYRTSKAYKSFSKCLGKNVEFNGFYEGNIKK